MINEPEREDQRENEHPGNGESLSDFVVAFGKVFREDHNKDHINDESNGRPSQRKLAADFVDEAQANGVGNGTHHTWLQISALFGPNK